MDKLVVSVLKDVRPAIFIPMTNSSCSLVAIIFIFHIIKRLDVPLTNLLEMKIYFLLLSKVLSILKKNPLAVY